MNKHIITIRIPRACDHDVRVAHRLACTCQMDRNSDGTLTKQEFMMMFGNVCEEVHVLLIPCSAHVRPECSSSPVALNCYPRPISLMIAYMGRCAILRISRPHSYTSARCARPWVPVHGLIAICDANANASADDWAPLQEDMIYNRFDATIVS